MTEEEIKTASISAYNKLITEKKEIIANAELIRRTLCNTDALQEEKQQLERIRVAEKRRQDALLALSREIPSTHAATTMADVEAACPAEFRASLHEIHERLNERVSEAQEASDANEFLIRHALGAVEYHLNRLSNSSIDPTYGQKGNESVTREKKFDFKA